MSAICVYTSSQSLPEITIDLQIVHCDNSSEIFTSADFSSSAADLITKQNDIIVTSLLSWYSVFLVFANRILTDKKYSGVFT